MSTFKIATYNIEFSRKADLIVQNLLQLKKDGVEIFCLQEVLRIPNVEFIIDKILKRLGNNWKAEYFLGEETDSRGHGVAIIWNTKMFHLESLERILFPPTIPKRHDAVLVKIAILIYAYPQLQRKALSLLFTYKGKPIRITTMHLELIGGFKNRLKQAEFILSKLQKNPVTNEIVCGDFNSFETWNTGRERRELQKLFASYSFVDATDSIPWTSDPYNIEYKGVFIHFVKIAKKSRINLKRKIDYIFSKGLTIGKADRIDVSGSDHFPIVAEFSLK